jgi:hypothetical protein
MTVSRVQQFELHLRQEIAQERAEAILYESPPPLREKIDWIRRTFEDEWRRSVVSRYQVAVVIREIYDDVTENKGSVYGARAVEAIQQAFGWDDGVIYQALHVADAFTPGQIEEITRMRLPGGRPLSYGHVVSLASVEDGAQREKLLRRAVREGWTARRLANAAAPPAAPQTAKQEDRRGRPVARPRDFDGVLDQQAHLAEDFLNRNDQVWSHPNHSLSAKADDLDTADFSQERADRLKRLAERMHLLAERAKERAEEATRLQALFVQVLQEQAGKRRTVGGRIAAGVAPDGSA